jgi:16S rRNA (cytidine1402-2'-O)-methyltransferase
MSKGTLYMLPVGLGSEKTLKQIPKETVDICNSLTHFVVERDKTARHFLKAIEYTKPLNDLTLYPLNKHAEKSETILFLNALKNGESVGVLSEAGCAGVADPGQWIAQKAHEAGFRVSPMIGPSSILLCLMASGLNGQQFCFNGYLPHDATQRKKKLGDMLKRVQSGETQLLMDTPFRNEKLIQELIHYFPHTTQLCIASNITTASEKIATRSLGEWKKQGLPSINKIPTMLALGNFE